MPSYFRKKHRPNIIKIDLIVNPIYAQLTIKEAEPQGLHGALDRQGRQGPRLWALLRQGLKEGRLGFIGFRTLNRGGLEVEGCLYKAF